MGGGGGGGFFAREGGGGGGAFFDPIEFRLVALGLRDGTLPWEVAGDIDLPLNIRSGLERPYELTSSGSAYGSAEMRPLPTWVLLRRPNPPRFSLVVRCCIHCDASGDCSCRS